MRETGVPFSTGDSPCGVPLVCSLPSLVSPSRDVAVAGVLLLMGIGRSGRGEFLGLDNESDRCQLDYFADQKPLSRKRLPDDKRRAELVSDASDAFDPCFCLLRGKWNPLRSQWGLRRLLHAGSRVRVPQRQTTCAIAIGMAPLPAGIGVISASRVRLAFRGS